MNICRNIYQVSTDHFMLMNGDVPSVSEDMTAFLFFQLHIPHHIICLICIIYLFLANWIKKNVKMTMKVCHLVIRPALQYLCIFVKNPKPHRTEVCQCSPMIVHQPPCELFPISAEQTSRDEGGRGRRSRASPANGKCQPLSRARNHKQPRNVWTSGAVSLRRIWRASCLRKSDCQVL